MKRVTGIGGVFFQARDPVALRSWYREQLGIDVQPWGGAAFAWTDDADAVNGTTAWSIGAAGSDLFAPGTSTFMINYRVDDLGALLGGAARSRLQCPREDGRLGIRQVRLGDRPGGQQGRALAAAGRTVMSTASGDLPA